MFFLCCGSREGKGKTKAPDLENEPLPAETDWLLAADTSVSYTDGGDKPERKDADLLREIVREAESKMVNITDRQPFLFHAKRGGTWGDGNSRDTSVDGSINSTSSNAATHASNDSSSISPSRGRHAQRRRHPSPFAYHDSTPQGMNGYNQYYGPHNGDRSTSNGRAPYLSHQNAQPRQRGSQSRSRSRSRSRSPGAYRNAYDAVDGFYPSYYPDDNSSDYSPSFDEETQFGRVRGPKLKVELIPMPKREEIRRQEELERELEEMGEITPVQERTSFGKYGARRIVDDDELEDEGYEEEDYDDLFRDMPDNVEVEPLSPADHEAIISLSNALWNALEGGMPVLDSPQLISRWQ